MGEKPQLVIRLRTDGTVQADTRHVYGDACVPFAALLEDLCDAEAIDSAYSADYYESTPQHQEIATQLVDPNEAGGS
jgi:hypothetical protein